eukprot:9812113-Alexandrium_andersonii.AAC.1
MSASLVGSEMCIRDSANTPEDQVLSTGEHVTTTGNERPSPPTRPATPDPVSYTHLTLPTICSV